MRSYLRTRTFVITIVVILVGTVLGLTVAMVWKQGRDVERLTHDRTELAGDVLALRTQVIALGADPVTGPPPALGEDGRDGRDGIDGKDGADGKDGRDGRDAVDDPDFNDPDPNDPDFDDPDPNDADPDDPEVQDPEVQDPEVQDPETQDDEIQDPEIQDPEVDDPDPNDPAALCPDGYTMTIIDQGPLAGWIACAPTQEQP
jgi:hypothetical protein